jgi:hypothetical protein
MQPKLDKKLELKAIETLKELLKGEGKTLEEYQKEQEQIAVNFKELEPRLTALGEKIPGLTLKIGK